MKILVSADWHLRSTVPSCLDYSQSEWIEIQKSALNRVLEIAKENKCDVIFCDGDVFHSEPTASFEVVQIAQDFAISCLNMNISFYTIAGNHDEIGHNSQNLSKGVMGVFLKSHGVNTMEKGVSNLFCGCNFNDEDYSDYYIIVKHILTMLSNEKPDYIECETPESLLKKYPHAGWILLGDYHRHFEFHLNNRHVINPGCLTVQAADFEGYQPGVYVIDTEKNTTEFVSIGIEYQFNRNNQTKKEIDQNIENFVNHIKKEEVTLDYVNSLKNTLSNYEKPIQEKITEWITRSGN